MVMNFLAHFPAHSSGLYKGARLERAQDLPALRSEAPCILPGAVGLFFSLDKVPTYQ